MKLLRTLAVVLSVASAGSTVAGAAPAPAADDAGKLLAFIDKLADAVVKDKDDCAAMAKDVNVIVDDNKPMLEVLKQTKGGKQLPPAARDHVTESVKRMLPGMQRCGSDKGVKAAFQRLDLR